MNSSRHLALVGLATLAMVVSSANGFAAGADSASPQEFLEKHYDLRVTIQSEGRVVGDMHLGSLTNAGQLDDYLRALADECKKYPATFFKNAGVAEIVLCGDLHMGPAPIAGSFNEPQKKLYLTFHWCQFGARCQKSFHAFHHELGHALQSAVWGNGHYDWRDWTALNPAGFNYGAGGNRELMAHPDKNFATWSTNQPGFLNPYSTTAPWEDGSEIMAALLNDGDRWSLGSYYRRDPVIQKKVDLMAGLLSKFCGPTPTKYFWEQAISSLRTPPAVPVAATPSQATIMADLRGVLGGDLIDAGGKAVSFETMNGKKYFLLYFSAAWCSKCRQFMPQFVEFYRNTKYHDQFEVIFVSSDKDEAAILSYLKEMPWKAVRFNGPAESFLKANYSRGPGIPTLALIDSDGQLLGFKKGFANNYDNGVDKMLEIVNQKLASENLLSKAVGR